MPPEHLKPLLLLVIVGVPLVMWPTKLRPPLLPVIFTGSLISPRYCVRTRERAQWDSGRDK